MIRKFLQAELEKRRSKNPRYSISAFARDLKIAPSSLHQILKGIRTPSLKKIAQILERTGVEPTQIAALIQLSATTTTSPDKLRPFTVRADLPKELVSSWLCYAVLSAFELHDFCSSIDWFAKRLGVEPRRMSEILDLLEESRLIDRGSIPWRHFQGSLSSGQGNLTEALRKVHGEYIEKSMEYLKVEALSSSLLSMHANDPENALADISGMTFSVDKKKLPEAYQMILKFRRSLAEYLCGGSDAMRNDELYRLNIQLSPISKPLSTPKKL